MSPRRTVALVAPTVLALGLAAPAAVATQPAEHVTVDRYQQPTFGDIPDTAVVADGAIDGVVRSGGRVYVHGTFDTIGRYSGPGRVLDTATGADRLAPVLPDGQVSVTVPDGDGGWYVGGDFGIDYYNQTGGGLAHVLADGTLDPDFHATADGLVSALALDGDTLYVGGRFDHLGVATRKNLGAVSAADGATLSFRADQGTRVTELVSGAGRVYVGSDGVAALDPVTGATVPGFVSPVDNGVAALALGGGRLYVGTDHLVAADPLTGALDPAFAVATDGEQDRRFYTVLYTAGTLYVGADLKKVAGRPGKLVALDPATGAAQSGFDPQVTGGQATFPAHAGVFDLALHGDQLWVGGAFDSAGGQPAGDLAVLDPSTGARLDVDVPSFDHQVNAVDVSGDDVYVGGHFFLDDPATTRTLAALDARTLQPVPGFHATNEAWNGELVAAPNALYVGPRHFYGYDPQTGDYPARTDTILAYDPDTGSVDRAHTHARIRDLTGFTPLGDQLVVARRLQGDVRFPRNRITVYAADGSRARSFAVPLRGYISYLTTVDGDLLAVGSFKRRASDGGPRNTAMLRFSARNGERRPYFDPHVHGPVYDAVVQGDAIFASGLFHTVHEGLSQARPGLTRMDLRSRKSEQFQPDEFGANRVLLRLAALGDRLWVGWSRNKFLDPVTGAVLPDPTGAAGDTTSIVRADGRLVFGATEYGINVAGSSWNVMGYVGRTDG